MDLIVKYNNCSSSEEAYQKIKQVLTKEYIKKFKVSASIENNDDKREIIATGKGFTLCVNFTENQLEVSTKLSLMVKPLKGRILKTIDKEFSALV